MEGMEADGIVGLIHTNKKKLNELNMNLQFSFTLIWTLNLYIYYVIYTVNIQISQFTTMKSVWIGVLFDFTNILISETGLWDKVVYEIQIFGLGSIKVRENDKSLN